MSLTHFLSFRHSVDKIEASFTKHGAFVPYVVSQDELVDFAARRQEFQLLISDIDFNRSEVKDLLESVKMTKFGASYDVLDILFYVFNFHNIKVFPLPTSPLVMDILKCFVNGFPLYFYKEFNSLAQTEPSYLKYTDSTQYFDLFKFSMFLKFNPPTSIIKKLFLFSNSKKVTSSSYARVNKVTKVIGYLQPHDQDITEMFVCGPKRLTGAMKSLTFPESMFDSSIDLKLKSMAINNESSVLDSLKFNIFTNAFECLKTKFNTLEWMSEQTITNNHLDCTVRPDLLIWGQYQTSPPFQLPVEVKTTNILHNVVEFLRCDNDDKKRLPLIHLFTQAINQMMACKSQYGIIADQKDLIFLEFNEAANDIANEKVHSNHGMAIRTIRCTFTWITINSTSYSSNAFFTAYLQHALKSYATTTQELMDHASLLLITSLQSSIPQIVTNHYKYMGKIFKYLFDCIKGINATEELNEADTNSNPSSGGSVYLNLRDDISNNTNLVMRAGDLKVLSKIILQHTHSSFIITTIENLSYEFRYIRILSGSVSFNNLAIVIKMQSKVNGKLYILKIYDPVRSLTWKHNNMNLLSSFNLNTKYINKEVSCLKRLSKESGFGKLLKYGFINNTNVYQENLQDETNFENFSVGGYFIITSFIDGTPLDKIATGRMSYYPAAFNTVCRLHSRGIYHGDISARNIIIRPDGTVSIIDFGLSILRSIQRNEGETNRATLSNFDDKRKEDLKRLWECFSEPATN